MRKKIKIDLETIHLILKKRIDTYISQFKPKESIVFFYANYDNPVSADEMKYLLLGCSVVADKPDVRNFPFTDKELENYRSTKAMKNFLWGIWRFCYKIETY